MSLFTGGIALATLLAGASVKAGADIYSANKTSGAVEHGADAQAAASAAQLAYTKQQAAIDQANMIATQGANYEQYSDRQQLLSTLGQHFGLPARTIAPPPTYQSVNGDGTIGAIAGTPPASTPTAAAGGTAPSPTDPSAIQKQLAANYASLGVQPTGRGTGPTDIAYYADQIAATGGLTASNAAYWLGPNGRIATDLAKTKTGAAPTSAASSSANGTLGSMLGTPLTTPVPGALAAPTGPWGF